ncbi:uncharacterized protein PAC_16021 [Phialocephala subalpina]|uniref:Pentatricopeptide repeat protein n=1 Tax=Phialocephala subalpina TaxID=576137 RepID=A0A1L7XM36_9HELO|nr:uncharacterized protein PAC_16021 [Phialocephala subalpina]
MSSSHICQACRQRLSQLRLRRLPQWQQRACFISLSKNSPQTTTDEKKKDGLLELGDDVGKRKGRYAAFPERPQRIPRPRLGSANSGDILESLFEQSISEAVASDHMAPQPNPPPGPYEKDVAIPQRPSWGRNKNETVQSSQGPYKQDEPPRSISSLEPYKNVEILKEMIKGSSPPADSFHFFLEHFGPDTEQEKSRKVLSSLPSYLHQTARNLLRKIIVAKARDPFSTTLPSVTELSGVYLRLGRLQAVDWADLMNPLIRNIINTKEQSFSDATNEQRLLSDLLGAWNVVCRNPGNLEDIPGDSSSQLNWSHIPPVSSRDAFRVYQKAGSVVTFGMLTPTFPIKSLSRIPPLALSTFHLLNCKATTVQNHSGDPARLLSLIGRLINVPGIDVNSGDVLGQDSAVAEFIEKHLPTIKDIASQGATSEEGEDTKRKFVHPQAGLNMGISFTNKRLHEALKTKNRHQVDELWSDVKQWPIDKSQRKEDAQHRGLSAYLCNYFILIYMTLRQPNRAIDVWNHMVQHGLMPNLATWDSMLSGCKAARDPVALEGVWQKMRMARVEPDIVCWTTRISGLMHCYEPEAAIRALDDMGSRWLEAAKKVYPKMPLEKLQKVDVWVGTVKPDIATVNAAMAGALARKRKDYAHEILAWAGGYGITPDVRTYNTLLLPLLREGQTRQVMGLLHQMQQSGIDADITTYTTILDETFRYAEDLSPEEQKEMVFGIFDEMEQAGLKPEQHTYGKIIHALLQSTSGDMTVVNIVLERMAKLNLEPSAHIYTSLAQHYFNQDPPQLDAAKGLIERASMVIGSTDHIFWDRVVEGYSRAGETAAALRILGKVNAAGNKLGWLTLRELLHALERNEEWDMAKDLVRDTMNDTGGPLSPEVKGEMGQHLFWESAHELKLVDA